MKALHKFVVTVAGAGYSPIAPGTAGSIFAIGVYLLIGQSENFISLFYFTFAITFALGFYSTAQMEKLWPHDSPKIVIDEFIGIWVSLLFVPFSIQNAILALVLFRIFDIWKPLGIRTIDTKLGGAAGVILDDVLAGVYANISLQIIISLIIP